jgi:glycosyltransferase involved in cell wall biosynthesis
MTTKENIILFTNSYSPVLGGIQTVCSQIAKESLKNKKYNLHIFTNKYPVDLKFFERIEGVPVRRFLLGSTTKPIENLRSGFIQLCSVLIFPLTFIHLLIMFIKLKPNIVNVHFPVDQTRYIILLSYFFKFKLITSFHGHDVTSWTDDAHKPYKGFFRNQKKLISISSYVTACSNYLSRIVEKTYNLSNHSVKTVYNGVDLTRFENISRNKTNKEYIFAFGRLETHKGFDILIQAFSKIQNKKIRLFIAGEGSELFQLKNQAKQILISDRVTFLGRLSAVEIASYSSKASINVIPSKREPFGIVVLEAIASGRPVLATNVGGIPELYKKEFGLLVKPNDVTGLSNAINKILNEMPEIKFEAIRKHVNRFSIEKMANNYFKYW